MGLSRARDVAQYVVERVREKRDTVTPLQLMKLVYLAHGFTLGVLGRPLIRDEFEAWQYGPVSRDLYEATRRYRSAPVDFVEGARSVDLDPEERSVVDQVIDYYSQFDGIRLSALTHEKDSPWDRAWSAGTGKNKLISNNLIENYYSQLVRSDISAEEAETA
ncbi:Panacea domain-containing protein [Lysobacter capsici]|uniref:Panacea domain-containing protein n=1 Tax=Lysobacter capsici TaxID=435897 RepID=UPI001C003819|nr:type II toxin-antitoxin system antitoxin SocA domain-containing protein [Lysobacter capsici]QWF18146.1 DUF4065 domain-containing protein [Lysobacter capsici]